MKKKIVTLITILVLGLVTATTVYASTVIQVTLDGTYDYDKANNVLELVNIERSNRGLGPLTMDYEITKTAQLRAKEASLYFSHTRSNGDNLKGLNIIGENLAAGATTPEGVMEDWMESSGHRGNILNTNYKSIGIASFKTKGGATYWVQVFHTSKASNTKKFTGSKEVTKEVVNLKLSLVKNIKVYDLKYKKLAVGEVYTISKAAIQNAGWDRAYTIINNSNFKFTSSDNNIATIDSNGTIKGISNGKVEITASFGGKSVSYEIQVGELPKEVESLSFTNSNYSMYVGKTLPYSVTVLPNNASSNLKWTSSNENIATVDNKGNVTSLSTGKTTITVTSDNGKKASFNLTVNELLINNLYITDYMNAIYIGDSTSIKTTISPREPTEKISYTSSNEKVAKVDSNGVVTGIGVGNVVITASSKNTKATAEIIVMKKKENNTPKEVLIESASLNCSEITLKVGEKFTPSVSVYPTNTTEVVKPTWIGFDYRVVEVYSDGTIIAKSAGEGVVSILVGKNNIQASCKIKVIAPVEVEKLEFPFLPSKLTSNEVRSMKVTVYPEGARDNSKLVWTSSNTEVATVTQDGILFTHSSGETTITVTASNGVKISKLLTVN